MGMGAKTSSGPSPRPAADFSEAYATLYSALNAEQRAIQGLPCEEGLLDD
jgi:hypothetical protein